MDKIVEIAKLAGLHVDPDGEIGPAFFGSVDTGYRKFASLIIAECIGEIHVADVGDLKGASYYRDRVAEHIENHFGVNQQNENL